MARRTYEFPAGFIEIEYPYEITETQKRWYGLKTEIIKLGEGVRVRRTTWDREMAWGEWHIVRHLPGQAIGDFQDTLRYTINAMCANMKEEALKLAQERKWIDDLMEAFERCSLVSAS